MSADEILYVKTAGICLNQDCIISYYFVLVTYTKTPVSGSNFECASDNCLSQRGLDRAHRTPRRKHSTLQPSASRVDEAPRDVEHFHIITSGVLQLQPIEFLELLFTYFLYVPINRIWLTLTQRKYDMVFFSLQADLNIFQSFNP